MAGPIQQLFAWNDGNGAATDIQARITSIDLADTIATVRLEIDNWTGHRFTDLFTLLKVDGSGRSSTRPFICTADEITMTEGQFLPLLVFPIIDP